MKQILNIIACICSVLSLPTSTFGQCMTLSEPLFLQAPDSICANKKDLIIKTSRIEKSGVRYLWRTPLARDTITNDSILKIVNPSVNYSGNYYVAAIEDTCKSVFFGPITVRVVGVPKASNDTIKTLIACNTSELTINSTYKPSSNIVGKWIGTEGVTFDKPDSSTTVVKGLKPGENIVVWSLSTAVCPFFIKDTFSVRHEIAPQIQSDGIVLKIGEASAIIHLDYVSGSNIDLLKEVETVITKNPQNGTLEKLSDGKRLKYSRSGTFKGKDAFELKVCNLRCPNLCSGAVPFTIDINFDDRYPNVTIPKALLPQHAGESQFFRIEKIENYPENQLTILDRWGNTIIKFENYTNKNPWDGMTDKGVLLGGAYYYMFEAKKDIASPDEKPLRPLTGIFYVFNN